MTAPTTAPARRVWLTQLFWRALGEGWDTATLVKELRAQAQRHEPG